jgi:fumarylpyruvate hydrolase
MFVAQSEWCGVTACGTHLSHDMFSQKEIIANLSEQFELTAGDLIFTGTLAIVGPLVVADTVAAGMDGVGELSFCIE